MKILSTSKTELNITTIKEMWKDSKELSGLPNTIYVDYINSIEEIPKFYNFYLPKVEIVL